MVEVYDQTGHRSQQQAVARLYDIRYDLKQLETAVHARALIDDIFHEYHVSSLTELTNTIRSTADSTY